MGWDIEDVERELRMCQAELDTHGKGKCVPADEFERAKEPIFAEGMRAGCEDLMREAARMDDELNRLREDVKTVTENGILIARENDRLREAVGLLEADKAELQARVVSLTEYAEVARGAGEDLLKELDARNGSAEMPEVGVLVAELARLREAVVERDAELNELHEDNARLREALERIAVYTGGQYIGEVAVQLKQIARAALKETDRSATGTETSDG